MRMTTVIAVLRSLVKSLWPFARTHESAASHARPNTPHPVSEPLFGDTGRWCPELESCHKWEIPFLMLRANKMGHPAISQRAGCPTMTLHLLSRMRRFLPRPHAIPLHSDTNPHFRFQTAKISFFFLRQNLAPDGSPNDRFTDDRQWAT